MKIYDVVITLPPSVIETITSVSHEYKQKYQGIFEVDGIHTFPHISLYFPALEQTTLPQAIEKIKQIAKSYNPFDISIGDLVFIKGKYIQIQIQPSEILTDIHMQLVHTLSQFRNGYIEEHIQTKLDQGGYLNIEKDHIKEYGTPYILETFSPHISLTELASSMQIKPTRFSLTRNTIHVTKLGIYEIGPHGTCVQQLHEFILKI